MHVENELPHLIKLLDDDDPAVRKVLSEQFLALQISKKEHPDLQNHTGGLAAGALAP